MSADRCLSWPCPDLSCMPCLTGFQPSHFAKYLGMADEIFFRETGARFTGDQCHIEISPCVRCVCASVCRCDPCRVEVIDLSRLCGIRNVCEIVDLTINGQYCYPDDDWKIIKGRYLQCPPTGWPQQDLNAEPGDECTWSITLRYGRRPPSYLVDLRDQWLWDKLAKKFSPKSICDTDREVASVSAKGVTYYKDRFDPLKEAKKHFPCRKKNRGGYWPKRDQFVLRKATGLVRDKWVGDKCDIDAVLKAWVDSDAQNISYATSDTPCPEPVNQYGLH